MITHGWVGAMGKPGPKDGMGVRGKGQSEKERQHGFHNDHVYSHQSCQSALDGRRIFVPPSGRWGRARSHWKSVILALL
jgi:hypothetical protein